MTRGEKQNGYILMPVVLAITLIATIAFMINYESSIETHTVAGELEPAQAQHVAQAGLAHAIWQTQSSGCAGDISLSSTAFGADSYTATATTPGGATTPYSLTADQDAWFRSDQPTVNNGTNADMHLRMETGNLEYALYRFDLSSLPAGSQINSASVWLYVTPTGPGGGAHPEGPLTIHRVTNDWTETGATWDTMSSHFDSAVIATIPAQPQDAVWVQVNLTAQLQAWVNGGEANYGIMLIPTGEGTHGKYVSREGAASEQPRLDVIVGTGPASPMDINVTGTLTGNPSPANDITRTLTRTDVPAWQPPSHHVFQPGAASGKDAYIWEAQKSTNKGTDDETWVSRTSNNASLSLLKFNMGEIPARSKILSATLSLHNRSGNNSDVPVTAHRITNPWNEDFVTWNDRDSGTAWDTAGGDVDPAAIAITNVGPTRFIRYEWDITSLVQGWTDGAYENYGVALATAMASSVGERFDTSDHADSTRHPRLTITYACECGSPCLAPQGSGTVGMVVINPSTLAPSDAYKKALFEAWGYTVNLIGENTNAADYMTAAASNDVFFISETVNVSQVGTRIKDVPIGVVSQDGAYNSQLGFATGSAWPVGPAINVTDTSHYITALFPAGSLDIYTAGMEQLTVSGTEAPGLQTLADTGGAGSLVVLDKGADMAGGGTAAGPRVMLPLGREAKFNWDYLNGNGRLLVQRALQWGTGNTGSAPTQNLLFVAAGTSPTAQEQLRIDLIESWGYGVNVIDDNDSQANFDMTVAVNDVAYVSSTVSNVALGTKLKAAPIGLVNEQGALVEEFGFGLQSVNYKSRIEIDVLDNTHYITTPFPTGLLTVLTGNQMLHMMTANKAPGFDALAQVFNTGSLWDDSLGVIDIGGDLYGGGTAAGRRVLLPWGDATFDVTSLNADGRTIMQRAIEWGAGAGPTPAPTYNVLLIVGNLTLSSKDVGYKALMESWGHTVALIDDGDSQANYDTKMAAADVVYASGSALGANMLDKATFTTKGVVNEVNGKIDNFGFSSSTSSTANFDTFSVTSPTHYITESFSSNPATVFNSSLTNPVPGGTIAPDMQKIGYTSGTLAMGTLELGATRYDGNPSQGRRVQMPFASAEAADLTADGETILQRAIEWAAGADSGGGGGGLSGTFLDQLNAIAYNGDDGTLSWSNDWLETGESDGPGSGDFSVVASTWCASGDCIQIREDRSSTRRLSREVDLTGATSATLSLNYRRRHISNPIGGTITLEISNNGGSSFAPLKVYQMDTQDAAQQSDSFDISAYIAPDTQIRFSTSNVLYETALYVDNVLIDTTGGGGGGGSCDGTFRDEFNARTFSGSDGTQTWAGDWLEVGESDGPTSGDTLITADQSNYQLRTRDNNNGGEGVEREADLTGAGSATLSYDYRRMGLDSSSDYTIVQISSNGASGPWTELTRYAGSGTDTNYVPASHNISSFISVNTRIRFKTSSSMGNIDIVWFDNIEILCAP